uniref:Uncharacterized protein n=1 Tax=Anolis carolinensis TaxID=28377 RepID=A0A803TS08_ANOCA
MFDSGHRGEHKSLTDAENKKLFGPCNQKHGHNYKGEKTDKKILGYGHPCCGN